MRLKVECLSAKDNGRVKVLHFPELLVSSEEISSKVVQRY